MLTVPPKQKTIILPDGGWRERSYYVVDVAYNAQNPVHRSILYTGFLNGPEGTPGGYEEIFNPTAEEKLSFRNVHYLKAISEIVDMREQP